MKFFLKTTTMLIFFSILSTKSHANLYLKSRGGLDYSLAIKPVVSRFAGGETISLNHFHRASSIAEIPYNPYLFFGFGLDYTLLISSRDGDPRLTLMQEIKKISTTMLGVHGLVKPQYPIKLSIGDLSLYTAINGGFGVSTPITFGTQPLSDFQMRQTSNFPSPFPLYLESTAQAGIEFYISEFFGLDLGIGYRVLWIAHPFVKIPNPSQDSLPLDKRKALWYDVSSLFINFGVKMTF